LRSRAARVAQGITAIMEAPKPRAPVAARQNGEREISTLAIGDLVITHSVRNDPSNGSGGVVSTAMPASRGAPMSPLSKLPARRSRKGSLSEISICRHAFYFDGLLVTIGSIVNGCSIVRCDADELQSLVRDRI